MTTARERLRAQATWHDQVACQLAAERAGRNLIVLADEHRVRYQPDVDPLQHLLWWVASPAWHRLRAADIREVL